MLDVNAPGDVDVVEEETNNTANRHKPLEDWSPYESKMVRQIINMHPKRESRCSPCYTDVSSGYSRQPSQTANSKLAHECIFVGTS